MCKCRTLFSQHLDSRNTCEFSQTSIWNGPSRGVGAREILKACRKKTSFSLVCINVLHQVDKKALCSTFEYLAVYSLPWANTQVCIPGYQLPVQYQSRGSTVLHHNSSPLPNWSRQSYAGRCTEDESCFSRDTTRGFRSIRVYCTLRAKVPN